MKHKHYFQLLFLITFLIFISKKSYTQSELMDNGNLFSIGPDVVSATDVRIGEYREFKIPENPEFDYIRFKLFGADGGKATVGNTSAQGGDGATVEFSIKIGNAAGELTPGQILRFAVGKKGQDQIVNSLATANSGGGGGTGIMIQENGDWIPLAIAGGGSGAKRRPSGGENGQGGRAGENGGDGTGDIAGTGGTNGQQGNSGAAGGGGGYYSGWFNDFGATSILGGMGREGIYCEGGTGNNGSNGGWGCGGGGGGGNFSGSNNNGPGGGGGYSGGGSGGCQLAVCRGGGGGSYLDSNYAFDQTMTAGGTSSSPLFGNVEYQFFCSSRFAAAPNIIQDASCFNTENIQFSEENPRVQCDEVTYRRVDNNETNTTGIFENLQPGQSYDFELLYAGEVVDTYTHIVGSDVDTEDPLVVCSNNNFTFDLDDNLNPIVTLDDIAPSASDNCGIVSTTIVGYGDSRTFSCDDAGSNTLTVRTTDQVGNTGTCAVTVEITGVYPEVSGMEDLDVYLDATGTGTLRDSNLIFRSTLSTACFTQAESQANYSVPTAYQNFNCDDIGTTSFLLDSADPNFPDANQTITVIDSTPVRASVADVIVELDESGVGILDESDLVFTVSDNCYTDAQIEAGYSIPDEFRTLDCTQIGTLFINLDKNNNDFPEVILQVTVESTELSFDPITTDFCANSSFDLTSLEDQITTASGTFAYTQSIERLYIPNGNDNNVSVIDLASNSVIATIDVGTRPQGVRVHPNGKKVYILNFSSNDVSVIDVESNTVETTIDVGLSPIGTVFNADGSRLYVTNASDDNISVINTATSTVVNTITTGTTPWGIALSPDDSKIYVSNESDNNVSVINASTGTTITTLAVQNNPQDVALSADGTKMYVANASGFGGDNTKGAISIIDISTDAVVETLFTDQNYTDAYDFAVHPTGNLYTSHLRAFEGAINRLEPNNGNTITYYNIEDGVSNKIQGISLNEDGSILYLVDEIQDKVIFFNTLTNTEGMSIAVGDVRWCVGEFYVKTTFDIADPTNYVPSENEVIDVAFDGGAECESTTTITFTEAYVPVDLLGIVSIVETDSLFSQADTIQTMGTVEVEADDTIIFEAAEAVVLQVGFHAKARSVFTARIRACGEGSESSTQEQSIEERTEEVETQTEAVQVGRPEMTAPIEVSIAPNPFSSMTNIQFYLAQAGDAILTITNMNGQVIHQRQYLEVSSGWQLHQFEANHLPDGMYFLHIQTAEQQTVKQLIIQE